MKDKLLWFTYQVTTYCMEQAPLAVRDTTTIYMHNKNKKASLLIRLPQPECFILNRHCIFLRCLQLDHCWYSSPSLKLPHPLVKQLAKKNLKDFFL